MVRRADRQQRKLSQPPPSRLRPKRHVGFCAAAGAVLLWASFPPVAWSWCAWIAPIPWLLLTRREDSLGKAGYGLLFAAGFVFWAAMLQGIRLAHPANYGGLLALSAYLAAYLPAFVAIVRTAVAGNRVPVLLAAPVAWTCLEWLRGFLFTGFSVGLLGHTQSSHLWLIQISDLGGAYCVSFVVMLVAACLHDLAQNAPGYSRRIVVGVGLGTLAIVAGYGTWRLHQEELPAEATLRVALLQGTRDKVFETNPQLERDAFRQYQELMQQATEADDHLDLIVWPEGAFTELTPEVLIDGPIEPSPGSGWTAEETRQRVEATRRAFAEKVRESAAMANRTGTDAPAGTGHTHLVVGNSTVSVRGAELRQYNSAMAIDPNGSVTARYHKMHLVMFGEYIPLARAWPWLARLTPIGAGLTPGDGPTAFHVKGFALSPSICFESTVPHLIRRQVRRLAQQSGQAPDVLINISDDGWFFGSSILDLHLSCAVFRAVELRRPMLVAANTGISAAIDGNGRVQQRLLHQRDGQFLIASVKRDGRFSGYLVWGDSLAALCLAVSLWWVVRRWWGRPAVPRPASPGTTHGSDLSPA